MAGLEPPPGFRVGPRDALLVALTPALGSHGAPSKTTAADLSGRAKAGGRGSRGCLWLLKGKHEPPQEPRPSLKSMMSDVWKILKTEKEYHEGCD